MTNSDNSETGENIGRARTAIIGTATTYLVALACGLLAANLYYAQPLISLIGREFGVDPGALGLIVTLTQIGYCLGLLAIVPLADFFEYRRLVMALVLAAAAAMALAGSAASAPLFLVAVMAAGIFSVGAQVLIPMAASLAPPGRQGRVIGTIMAGLLGGIMLARPFSSALAEWAGWRMAFLIPSLALGLLALLLWKMLPQHRSEAAPDVAGIVRSMAAIVRDEPVLLRRAFYQACLFAAFNLFWTASPIVLESELGLDHGDIALFALAGAGGALAAPLAGRLADRGLTRVGSAAAMALLAASFALTLPALALASVVALAVLAVLLDAATQANQVLSQNVVYSLRPEARGRINAIYMTLMFVGGALGSGLAPFLYVSGGWTLCAAAGTGLALLALAVFATERRKTPRPA